MNQNGEGKAAIKWSRMHAEEIIKTCIKYIYPVIFFESTFANMFSYYVTFGNKIEWLRKLISWGLILCIFVLAISYLLFCLKEKRKYITVVVIPLIIFGGLTVSFFGHGGNAAIVKQMIIMCLYGVPAFTFAVYAVVEKVGRKLFDTFFATGVFMLPGYILFIVYSMSGWAQSENWSFFGGMSYLNIGYSALFLFAGMMMSLIWGERELSKINYVMYAIAMPICLLVVVVGGSRGAFVGAVMLIFLTLGVMLFKRYERKKLYFVPLGAVVVLVTSLLLGSGSLGTARLVDLVTEISDGTFVDALSSEESDKLLDNMADTNNDKEGSIFSEEKLNNSFQESSEANVETEEPQETVEVESEVSSETKEPQETHEAESEVSLETKEPQETHEAESEVSSETKEPQETHEAESEVNSETKEPQETHEAESEVSSETKEPQETLEVESEVSSETEEQQENVVIENEEPIENGDKITKEENLVDSITNGSMSRVYLYKLSLREITANPIFGIGGYGFQLKYGTDPHNVFLHALVDFGIPITVAIFIYILGSFVYAVKNGQKWSSAYVILFCCALGVSLIFGGIIYQNAAFMWIITYYQAAAIYKRGNKKLVN